MKAFTCKFRRPWAVGLATLSLALVTGCANNAVYFTTMTRTGVEISAMDGGKQSAHVGFERFEGVMMPTVYTNSSGQTATLNQAYPVYAEYEYATGGLLASLTTNETNGLVLRQVFATGKAATKKTVQKKVQQEFKALGGSVPSSKAIDAGMKLNRLLELLATTNPGERFADQLIKAINKHLNPTPKATSLEEAANVVTLAPPEALEKNHSKILAELGL